MKVSKEIKVKVKIDELLPKELDQLKELKAKKNGEITAKQLLLILLNELNANEIEDMAVVRRYKDGTVATGWTTDDGVTGLGLAEFLMMHIQDEIKSLN